MTINLIDLSTKVYNYLSEVIKAESIKAAATQDHTDYLAVIELITDIRFQTDFSLVSSVTELEVIYEKYRVAAAGESNVKIRTLLDLSMYLRMLIEDLTIEDADNRPTNKLWETLIRKLVNITTMHSTVDGNDTFYDESILIGLKPNEWINILQSNPWLVASFLIRLLPTYYALTLIVNSNGDNISGGA